MGYELLLGALGLIILTNGIPEMIISILAAEGICRPLKNSSVTGRSDIFHRIIEGRRAT